MKIKNKGFLTFLFIAVILSIGTPIYQKFYLKPKAWKEEFLKMSYERFLKEADSTSILNFCDCVYSHFSNKYGNVDNFPDSAEISIADKEIIVQCTIINLVKDSTEKENILKNIDSILGR